MTGRVTGSVTGRVSGRVFSQVVDGWTLSAVVFGTALLAWNIMRLTGAPEYVGSSRRLVFLPEPAVSRAMAIGHINTAAKIQWMDSFTYFQAQIDVRDDSVAGGERGAFDRLYSNLVGMDPLFAPYYEYGATAMGGLVEDHQAELKLLMTGTYHRPDHTNLWTLRMACLQVFFDYEERFPEHMEVMLQEWADAERAAKSGREYWPLRWIENLGRKYDRGLIQAEYWGRQLLSTKFDSQRGTLAQGLMREQLARHGVRRLQALADRWHAVRGAWPASVSELAVPSLVATVYQEQEWAMSPGEPIVVVDDAAVLRTDPYGFAYQLQDGEVASRGLEQRLFERLLAGVNQRIVQAATSRGAWPDSVDEAWSSVKREPLALPPDTEYKLESGRLATRWVGEDLPAWSAEELLTAVGLGAESTSAAEATE